MQLNITNIVRNIQKPFRYRKRHRCRENTANIPRPSFSVITGRLLCGAVAFLGVVIPPWLLDQEEKPAFFKSATFDLRQIGYDAC
jgi:hypothetical protein